MSATILTCELILMFLTMADYTKRIQVNMSSQLKDAVSLKADKMGVSIPEYVRYVLMKEYEREEMERDIKEARNDIKHGRVIKTKSTKEAIQVLRDLAIND